MDARGDTEMIKLAITGMLFIDGEVWDVVNILSQIIVTLLHQLMCQYFMMNIPHIYRGDNDDTGYLQPTGVDATVIW